MATLINFPVEGGGLSIDLNNADSGAVPYTNVDMLGGILANKYALKSDIVAPPVTSVNGKTGAVTINVPVTSVNGKTGAITLSASDVKAAATSHTHGKINSNGTISGITQSMLLITDSSGNIVASRTFGGDITINGTITANKVVGAVYA